MIGADLHSIEKEKNLSISQLGKKNLCMKTLLKTNTVWVSNLCRFEIMSILLFLGGSEQIYRPSSLM